MVLDALNEVDLDCALLAGRHTLLEQNANRLLDEASKRGMAVVIGGVFNSGILAAGAAGNRKFNYKDVPEEVARKVGLLSATCSSSTCRRQPQPSSSPSAILPSRPC